MTRMTPESDDFYAPTESDKAVWDGARRDTLAALDEIDDAYATLGIELAGLADSGDPDYVDDANGEPPTVVAAALAAIEKALGEIRSVLPDVERLTEEPR